MIKGFFPIALALWAGAALAEDVAFLGGERVVTLPDGLAVGRTFGEGDTLYAVELVSQSVEAAWTDADRAPELPDMDRMEAAFGLTFPSADCSDYISATPVLPTRCKQTVGMSILVIPQTAADSGAQLGNQMGLLASEVDAAWAAADFDTLLTSFCENATHPHRVPETRDTNSATCISDRPALAPHFLSYRLIIDADHAVVMYAQNIAAETDVIMTYGIDPFLELLADATDIEATLFAASTAYVAENGRAETYLLDVLESVQ